MTHGGLPSLVVTGTTGFVGRRVLRALAEHAASHPAPRSVTILVRQRSSLGGFVPWPTGWRVVEWDLTSPEGLKPGVIPAGSVVLHLASATGGASASAMRRAIVEGSQRLAEAARAAGAGHLIYVSSIAAGFANRRWYPYAEAKRAAEAAVLGSGVPVTIVRPTMVFGMGSPVQEGLERLATGAAPIVLGSGGVEVQPIDVDDLAGLLLALAGERASGEAVLEVGGRERCTMRELLAGMRAARKLAVRDPWSIRLGLPRFLLAMAEPILGSRLPVTAGQLASFLNNSTATSHPAVQRLMPAPVGLTEMLRTKREPNVSDEGEAAREFGVFARYLGTANPGAAATAMYGRGVSFAEAIGGDALDAWLLRLARRSVVGCGLADAYARLARPYGPFRRRLVLTLAILESDAVVHAAYDAARHSSPAIAWLSIGMRGGAWMVRTILAVLLLAPLHLAIRVAGRGAHGG